MSAASRSAEDVGNWPTGLQNMLENERERLERGNKETHIGELLTKGLHQATRMVVASQQHEHAELS